MSNIESFSCVEAQLQCHVVDDERSCSHDPSHSPSTVTNAPSDLKAADKLPYPALPTPEFTPSVYTMASPPPVEDQARLLEDALGVVRQQTLLMRRCLETPGKLMDALKCRYAADP